MKKFGCLLLAAVCLMAAGCHSVTEKETEAATQTGVVMETTVESEGQTEVTGPLATKPTATEPAATKPTATEPAATKPTATEPAATKPTATEPAATKPTATEPAATKPTATEPAATKPTATEPDATEPSLSQEDIEKCLQTKAERFIEFNGSEYFETSNSYLETEGQFFSWWESAYWHFGGDLPKGILEKPTYAEFYVPFLEQISQYLFGKTFDRSLICYVPEGVYYSKEKNAYIDESCLLKKQEATNEYSFESLYKEADDTYVLIYEVFAKDGGRYTGNAHMTMVDSAYGYVIDSFVFEPNEGENLRTEIL